MQQTQLPASSRANSESLIYFETAPSATFLHRRPLHCSSNYHSCASGHFPAEAATCPAPATIFLHQQIPAATCPEPETFLQQRLSVLHPQLSVLHQRLPSCTSRYQQLPVLHQQLQVLNQRPPIQWKLVLYQLSRSTPATRSCFNDHHPVAAIVRCTLFPISDFMFGLSKQHPCFVILAYFVVNHLQFKSFRGPVYLSGLCNTSIYISIYIYIYICVCVCVCVCAILFHSCMT